VAPPSELVRLAASPDGSLAVGSGPGRGAWVCAGSPDCVERALRRATLARALRRTVTDDDARRVRARLLGPCGVPDGMSER
jgi:predicted RNA-binding protein YlxR (DUF448 family)